MINDYSAYILRTTDKGNTRYYKLDMERTLFDSYCVERKYGNIRFKSHTGQRVNYFDELAQAIRFFDKILRSKQRKGYK